MVPIVIQVSRSQGKVKGQAYSSHVGEGGIIVLQTSIFVKSVYHRSTKPKHDIHLV